MDGTKWEVERLMGRGSAKKNDNRYHDDWEKCGISILFRSRLAKHVLKPLLLGVGWFRFIA